MDQEIIYSCLETRNREYYRNVQKVSEQIKVDIYIYTYNFPRKWLIKSNTLPTKLLKMLQIREI